MTSKDQEAQVIALAELEALVKVPGALKIITSEVIPSMRLDRKDARSPVDPATIRAIVDDPNDPRGSETAVLASPSTFVCHDVIRIEPDPAKDGAYRAYSVEGDWTLGYPEALIRRLRQWRDG